MKRWVPALGWGLCILALASMAVGIVMQEVLDRANEEGPLEQIGLLLGFASFPVIGALIVSRQPRNAIGWIFLQIGLGVGVLMPATEYAYLALVREPGSSWPGGTFAAWLEAWLWFPGLMAIPTLGLLLFPDGRPPSKRWNWVAWASVAIIAAVSGGAMFQQTLQSAERGGDGYSIRNPVGFLPFDDAEQAMGPLFLAIFPLMFLCVASLIVRFRRSGAEQRQQLKLLLAAAVVFTLAIILGESLDLPGVVFALSLWTIPAAVGVAILRYRLYDVDVIINRTLVYGALTGVLVLVYLGVVVVMQSLLTGVTQDSDIAVAASTLAVAALFRPVRARIQGFIDRRFNRRKYDARLTLENFSSRLRDEVDLDHLVSDLTFVVRETMQPAHVSVWMRSGAPPARSGATP